MQTSTTQNLTDSLMTNTNLDDAIVGGAALPPTVDENRLAKAKNLAISSRPDLRRCHEGVGQFTFMEDGLPGFDEGFEMGLDDLSNMLKWSGVSILMIRRIGVIQHYINHAVNGWYSDCLPLLLLF